MPSNKIATMNSSTSLSDFTQAALFAAQEASLILKKGFLQPCSLFKKAGRNNYATEYDHAAERSILNTLKAQFPTHRFLSEEMENGGTLEVSKDDILWVIDPLDGTNNFIHHIPQFAISIAATQNNQVLSAIIYQPLTDEYVIAEKGKGTIFQGTQQTVSSHQTLESSLVITGISSDEQDLKKLAALKREGVSFRNYGSATIAFFYLATGRAEALYLRNLYSWDFAAGKLLVEEAGGIFLSHPQDISFASCEPSNILACCSTLYPDMKNKFF